MLASIPNFSLVFTTADAPQNHTNLKQWGRLRIIYCSVPRRVPRAAAGIPLPEGLTCDYVVLGREGWCLLAGMPTGAGLSSKALFPRSLVRTCRQPEAGVCKMKLARPLKPARLRYCKEQTKARSDDRDH